ncbi:MAG: substrate-binding domain-containing protein [Spirochaetaceae bacterium]|jgi:ribose transport system substrate-binding protein|nr:substrate-binding domain-containing protein [Spirochaetaceae bacterium]
MRKNYFSRVLLAVIAGFAALAVSCQGQSGTQQATKAGGADLRIVIVPKVVHPWFDDFATYARLEAAELGAQTGRNITIDYRAPTTADVAEQNSIIQQAAATRPAGIAIDLLDYNGTAAVIEEVRRQGIPVVFFDAEAPDDSGIPQVGSPSEDQARIAAEYLAKVIGYRGKVAVMRGVPTAPNHEARYSYYFEYFKRYPDITVIQGGVDNDDIQTAQQQAAGIIAQNPDLAGYIGSNAAYPIGVGNAVREAGKVGQIHVVGLEGMAETLDLIKSGVIDGSSSAPTVIQAAQVVLLIWQQSMGNRVPLKVNTGIDLITKENVDDAIAEARNFSLKDPNLKKYGIGQNN